MACGTPVVVGDIPDYDPRYIEKDRTVLMAEPTNAESVAQAILSLLTDASLAERLSSEAARRVRATGSYESQMARMDQLYADLLRGSRNGKHGN
jgi:glycosyltransferase involved in cell wall biosynthesis